MNHKTPLLLFTMVFIPLNFLFAQRAISDKLQHFQAKRNDINQTAMLVLGSWAAANILVGSIGNFKTEGETKYFHQLNATWNAVNLGIAALGYFKAVHSDPAAMTNVEMLKDYNSLQSFLLLNAGLDAAYIMTGLYLKEKSKHSSSAERLKGYGNSLLLQGGFLLLFDVSLYFIHLNHANIHLYPHLESLAAGGFGLGISIRL
ncbi:hypothetical protein FHS56_001467 [Thermonema lapsum]|uniref:Uncharacterized protein n=1 Tax=Thermonema lapsum TaxID=28195 RepID=A0A846MQU4_9BACT|nr:hypothetical protein [Thermonema lapsum]NIK73954.1 hypothetical protein [Thermonema lapsum]